MAVKSRAVDALEEPSGSPLTRLVWLVGAIAWLVIVAAMVSHSPADPPGHAVAPVNSGGDIANWVGPVGAAGSYHLLHMLGSGAWIVILATGGWLAHIAWRGPVGHTLIRGIGVLLVAVSLSGFHALFAPEATNAPEGAGGLLAIIGVHELTMRFGTLGTAMWLVAIAAVGSTVAFDRWLFIVPAAIARMAAITVAGVGRVAGGARRGISTMRANDIDDDTRLGHVQSLLKAAAKRSRRGANIITIDESAGGIGGARFDADEELPEADEAEEEEEWDEEDEWEEVGEEEEDEEPDHASVVEGFEVHEQEDEAEGSLSEEELRAKISKLPVRFANASKKLASEDDLEHLRAQRASEEEADRNYVYPGLDLLTDPEENFADELEGYIRDQAQALEHALSTYRIDGHVAGVDSGPVITLYQIALSPGTKVSSVTAVSSDIARMLKATNIRIVPNTEGLDTVGIEVPNRKKEKVRLKELMASSETTARMKLPLFLGKDASGAPLIVDLASLPHLLIAGTTGSGKSVCMNAIIMGFLYTQKPSDLKLVLVDPKMVELSQFRDIPHLMCPVVTEMSKAAAILEWAVTKMDERYELLAEAGCRDMTAYNSLGWEELRERFNPATELEEAKIPRKLPYLVFVIDELADMMMTNKEVETSIVRIAQKARAVGIHLILATQRPQANVVTGLIKSNMPGRLSFKVASAMDSRIVLDQKGGELLLGQGDMLMLTPRSSQSIRAQGTLVDDLENRRVVRFIRDHATQNFEGQLIAIGNHGYEAKLHEDRMRESAQEDPLFDRAVELVLESGRGSVSMLQRRLAIGYTRSARLIEMMGEAGIIGGHKGTVAREVNMTVEEWQALKSIAEGDAEDEAPQGMLFEAPTPPAPEVTQQEKAALHDVGLETRLDEETGEVALIDNDPSATDRYANTIIDDEDADHADTIAPGPESPPAAEDQEPEPEPVIETAERDPAPVAPAPTPAATTPAFPPTVVPIADASAGPTENLAAIEADTEAIEVVEEEEHEPIAEVDPELLDQEDAEDEWVEEEAEEESEPVAEEDAEDDEELIDEEEEALAEDEALDENEEALEQEDEEEEEPLDEDEEDAVAEEDEEEAEEDEYEYEYVDEDGNPIDPEDLEEEDYEIEDAEEEAESDEESPAKATDDDTPEVKTRPVTPGTPGTRKRESAA